MDALTNQKPQRCKRPAGPLTRRQLQESHRVKMTLRRIVQRARVPGFTPVANNRVNNACQEAFAGLAVTHADKIANGLMNVADMQEQAVRMVARNLPPPRQVFDWQQNAVSKNNDPAYRKPFVRDTGTLARRIPA